ncbi:hypothetical protein RJ55_07997 [Drechmeria coniospora]|nr:hypothetical protein RJ55_07997 [Drechmeria coniospora]
MPDWAIHKVVELKAELKRRGLGQAGLKAELVARLQASDEQTTASQEQQQKGLDDADGRALVNELDNVADTEEGHGDGVKPATEMRHGQPAPTENDEQLQQPAAVAHIATVDLQEPMIVENQDNNDSKAGQYAPGEPAAESLSSQLDAGESGNDQGPGSTHETIDSVMEEQNRKRRSASPTPKDEAVKRRRIDESLKDATDNIIRPRAGVGEDSAENAVPESGESPLVADAPIDTRRYDDEVSSDDGGACGAPVHAATSALYINNLMRPLREAELGTHLADLATPAGGVPDENCMVKLYVDSIRTHAFAVFDNMSSAARVRRRLHGRVWPPESTRKALSVDFIPECKVDEWIRIEQEGSTKQQRGHRWEVVYQGKTTGDLAEAALQSSFITPSSPLLSTNRGLAGALAGTRGHQHPVAQSADSHPPPPPSFPGQGQRRGPESQANAHDGRSGGQKRTMAMPPISFSVAPRNMVERRLREMRSYYVRNETNLGREINRMHDVVAVVADDVLDAAADCLREVDHSLVRGGNAITPHDEKPGQGLT